MQGIKKFVAGMSLAAAALVLTGAGSGDQTLIETTYTVQQGDTLRNISEEYMGKNTGGCRYILEFESGIKELNPWLLDRPDKCMIYPGDTIRINYWTRAGGNGDE